MSDKTECPGCGSCTSSILAAFERGEPCPNCGLSSDAAAEIGGVRRRRADEDLKSRLEKALVERDRALAEVATLRGLVVAARRALGCEVPYAPHDAIRSDGRE